MKDDFFSVNALIVVALILSIVLVGYNAFLLPQYEPVSMSYREADFSASASASANLYDINSATAEQLQNIPGIGPVLAERILAYRQETGGFQSLTELKEVEGIGDATYQKIIPFLTLGEQ